jgi:hypothetical protein
VAVTVQIGMDDEEAGALRMMLDDALRDLSHEIADTDNASFREGLRTRRELLQRVRTKLGD